MFQVDQLRSGYFGNLSKVGSVVGFLSVIVQCQFLLHICILVGVMFLAVQTICKFGNFIRINFF